MSFIVMINPHCHQKSLHVLPSLLQKNQPPKPPALSPYYQKALNTAKTPSKPPSCNSPSLQPVPCYMFNPSSSEYKAEFPTLDEFEDTQQRIKHVWKIKTPLSTDPCGQPKTVNVAEAALIWRPENAVAQNQVLTNLAQSQTRLETKMSTLDVVVHELKAKIHELYTELLHIANTVKDILLANQVIVQKEKEKKHLEA